MQGRDGAGECAEEGATAGERSRDASVGTGGDATRRRRMSSWSPVAQPLVVVHRTTSPTALSCCFGHGVEPGRSGVELLPLLARRRAATGPSTPAAMELRVPLLPFSTEDVAAAAACRRSHHLGTAAQDIDGDIVRLEQGTAAVTGAGGIENRGIESKGVDCFLFLDPGVCMTLVCQVSS